MQNASYYSLIERGEDGRFFASVPDLPGVTVSGHTEEEVIRALSREVRQCVRSLILSGEPVPRVRPVEELPASNGRTRVRQLLLLIG